MKQTKLIVLLILVPVLAGLIIAVAYYNSANNSPYKTLPSDSSQSTASPSPTFELQVLSPENITYPTSQIPLNVSANKTSKITYMLDGEDNLTLSQNGEIRRLPDGVHAITFYAFDNESKLEAFRTVIFTVKNQPPPPPTQAEAINYFASQGFTIQKVDDVTIDGYYSDGKPKMKNSMMFGSLQVIASYANMLKTTTIFEFDSGVHWKIFFVESEVTNSKFYACAYD